MRKTAILLALVMAAPAAFAAGLSKQYKNWDKTPESYFLTNVERDAWKKVRTDADAEKFIQEYKEKRGPQFEKMLAERVAPADKYFSSGSTKGSETLRGRVLIMFGPPSAIENSGGTKSKETADPNRAGINGGDAGIGMSNSGVGGSPLSPSPRHAAPPSMTFVYDAAHAPKAIGKPFKAEINVISSSYQEPADPADLNAKFEAVAQASIASAAETKEVPPPPPPQ